MDTEIQLYLDHALRDLEAAESNLNSGFYHISVSRSYYAMFYAASALLIANGVKSRKHTGVMSEFGEHFIKTGLMDRKYGKMLHSAYDARLDSDYDVAFNVDEETIRKLVKNARLFVEEGIRFLQKEG